MSAELAVGLAAVAFVLMVGIIAGFAGVVLVDTAAGWTPKPRPRHRRSPGVQFFAYDADTTPIVILPDGRPVR